MRLLHITHHLTHASHCRFDTYLKEKLGPELELAKGRGGGYTRVEPSGTQFIRSICKLTHTGRKQYAKGML
jgi:hypothetical protein